MVHLVSVDGLLIQFLVGHRGLSDPSLGRASVLLRLSLVSVVHFSCGHRSLCDLSVDESSLVRCFMLSLFSVVLPSIGVPC